MKINLNFNWNWNKIGLAVSILILVAMLIAWALFAPYIYCSYFSEIFQEKFSSEHDLIIQNAIVGFLLYVAPILLTFKNIKLLCEIFQSNRDITKNDMYSLLYIALTFYILFAISPFINY